MVVAALKTPWTQARPGKLGDIISPIAWAKLPKSAAQLSGGGAMKACNLTKAISYRDMLDLIENLNEAAVVQAEFATGGGVLLKGREVVEGIARNGKAEHVPVLTITVVNTTQAEIIAAMLQVGPVDEGMARRTASMLNEAVEIGPERLH